MSDKIHNNTQNASEVVRIRFSAPMYKAIKKVADAERRKITDTVRILIIDGFQKRGVRL